MQDGFHGGYPEEISQRFAAGEISHQQIVTCGSSSFTFAARRGWPPTATAVAYVEHSYLVAAMRYGCLLRVTSKSESTSY